MLLLTTTEFRNNIGKYLDLAFTEKIALKSKKGIIELSPSNEIRSSKAVPIEKDDALMTKEEFFAKIDRARAEYDEGKFIRCNTHEDLMAFLNSL